MDQEFAIKLSEIHEVDEKIFSILKESVKNLNSTKPSDPVTQLHHEILRREKEQRDENPEEAGASESLELLHTQDAQVKVPEEAALKHLKVIQKSIRSKNLIRAYLTSHHWAKYLKARNVDYIVDFLDEKTYQPGEVITAEDSLQTMFLKMHNGEVEVSKAGKPLCTVSGDILLNTYELCNGTKSVFTFTAQSEVRIWALEADSFKLFLQDDLKKQLSEKQAFLKDNALFKKPGLHLPVVKQASYFIREISVDSKTDISQYAGKYWLLKNEQLKCSGHTFFEKECVDVDAIQKDTVNNAEIVNLQQIDKAFAEVLVGMQLLRIENRAKKIKIDTTVADEHENFEEEARQQVQIDTVPACDSNDDPWDDESLEALNLAATQKQEAEVQEVVRQKTEAKERKKAQRFQVVDVLEDELSFDEKEIEFGL